MSESRQAGGEELEGLAGAPCGKQRMHTCILLQALGSRCSGKNGRSSRTIET